MSTNLLQGESQYYKTYNNVIDNLKCIGANHPQINTTTDGDIYDIDLEKNTIFPLLHINPVNVRTGKGELIYNFKLFLCDLVEPHYSNEQDVMNDTLHILTDIIAYLKHRSGINEKFHIDTNASFTCEPFTERFDNALFGWVMDLSIRTQWDYSDCLDVFGERDSQVKSTSNCLR